MPPPPVYADECVQRPVIEALRERGFDVVTALEAGRRQESNVAQLTHAHALDRVLTYNRRDFRRLHRDWLAAGRGHAGIVIVPQTPPAGRRVLRISMLLDWLGTPDAGGHHSRLFQWNDLQQLLHASSRLAGYTEEQVRDALGEV